MVRCLILHGKGLQDRGITEQAIKQFGKETLRDYNVHIHRASVDIGCEIETYQSDDAVELAQRMDSKNKFSVAQGDGGNEIEGNCANGIVIAPGLFTVEEGNPLVAAIERATAKGIPVYEVHISNFAKSKITSSIGHVVTAQIGGFGMDSYTYAMRAIDRDLRPLEPKYTMRQVAEHVTLDDCWVVVNGKIYNMSEFLDDHPGGKRAVMLYAGKDASAEFNLLHRPGLAERLLEPEQFVGNVFADPKDGGLVRADGREYSKITVPGSARL